MARAYPQPDNATTLIDMDLDSTFVLPNGPPSGQPIAIGTNFVIADNLGRAASTNITFSGPIGGGVTGVAITTAFGSTSFRWTGASWIQK